MYNGLDLLEYLARELNCMFLSDLHSGKFLGAIRERIRMMEWDRFSLKDWNDAVAYITGRKETFDTVEQAADYLLHYTPHDEIY